MYSFHALCWNINGWKDNHIIHDVLENCTPDIFIIVETHLAPKHHIKVNTYKAICHNRIHTYRNARRHYGGVCILLKEDIFYDYNVSIKDKNFDGILAISIECKMLKLSLLVIAAYLPPGNSLLNFMNILHHYYIHMLILTCIFWREI